MPKKKRNLIKSLKSKDFKRFFHKETLLLLSSALVILFLSFQLFFFPDFFQNKNSFPPPSETIKESPKESIPLSPSQIPDFSSTEEGTLNGWIKGQSGSPPSQVVVLFLSARLPGFALLYYPQENRLIGGTPQMTAEKIILFDNKDHQLAYTFKKNGKQVLYYDGAPVASSDFQLYSSQLTGMAIGVRQPSVSELFEEIEIS